MKRKFRQNAGMAPADMATQKALLEADQVAVFLRTNLVQAKRDKDGDVWSE